jgi:hypothetical protein
MHCRLVERAEVVIFACPGVGGMGELETSPGIISFL